ncbi:hypothetical protein FKM82_031125 [Ascaphus truei]
MGTQSIRKNKYFIRGILEYKKKIKKILPRFSHKTWLSQGVILMPLFGTRFSQVECIDEHEANLALKEAMVLLNLQHPNICAYKEFFITWDNTISSLFLSLVMDVSDQGDLGGIVRLKRQLVKKMDETVIQMLLGQAIDVLVYIHKQKVLHRNLKPSNILLKDEASFLLSDFVVETLAADEMKLKIRMDDECKLWMAPEALQFSYSEKSDVWSLGCVLLDMMTCSITTDAEVAALLQEIRLDPVCLENVLKTLVGKVGYSADLCQVLLQMLQIHPEQRATAIELVDVPYVKKCLILVGSPLSGVKKTLPPGVSDELYEGGIEKALGKLGI